MEFLRERERARGRVKSDSHRFPAARIDLDSENTRIRDEVYRNHADVKHARTRLNRVERFASNETGNVFISGFRFETKASESLGSHLDESSLNINFKTCLAIFISFATLIWTVRKKITVKN